MFNLGLFGCYHFNRFSVVTSDLESFAEETEADAFAVEFPAREGNIGALIIKFPFVYLGGQLLYLLIQGPAFALFNRDVRSTEYCAAERVANDLGGVNVHLVDRHPLHELEERTRIWVFVNWLLLIPLVYLYPLSMSVLTVFSLASTSLFTLGLRKQPWRLPPALTLMLGVIAWWALLTGIVGVVPVGVLYLSFVFVALASVSPRNKIMLDNIQELTSEHGYTDVCLVTGKAHVSGLLGLAMERGITVTGVFQERWLRHGNEVKVSIARGENGIMVDPHAEPAIESAGSNEVLMRRATAVIVDWFIILVLSGFFYLLAVFITASTGIDPGITLLTLGPVSYSTAELAVITWLAVLAVYHLFQEIMYGRSFGKRLLGLVVVQTDGSRVSRRSALLRWLSRPVDFLPAFYVIAAIIAVTGNNGQRFGDHLAGTTVVLTKSMDRKLNEHD